MYGFGIRLPCISVTKQVEGQVKKETQGQKKVMRKISSKMASVVTTGILDGSVQKSQRFRFKRFPRRRWPINL